MIDAIQSWDESALVWIAEHLRNSVLTPVLSFYTQLGNHGLLFIALAALMLLFRATRKAGAAAGAGMFLGLLVTNLTIKPLVMRPRPWITIPDFTALVAEHDPNSFPSGHSCCAFAFAVALAVVLPQKWAKALALAAAAVMALSRLYVGVHFPTDVIVGTVIGTLCGLFGAWVVRAVIRRYESRKKSA